MPVFRRPEPTPKRGSRSPENFGDLLLTVDFLDLSAWIINFQDGDYITASGLIDEAVTLARQEGGAWNVARTLSHRGVIVVSLDPDQARADFGEAMSISREIGDQHYLAFSLMHLGDLELLLENVDEGRDCLQECVSICRDRLGSQAFGVLAEALDSLGLAAIMQGDVANALCFYDESFRLAQEMGSSPFRNMLGLALCLNVSGELDLATMLHGAADGLIEQNGQSWAPLGDKYASDIIPAFGVPWGRNRSKLPTPLAAASRRQRRSHSPSSRSSVCSVYQEM